jgi:hypothetical protein
MKTWLHFEKLVLQTFKRFKIESCIKRRCAREQVEKRVRARQKSLADERPPLLKAKSK